MPRPTTKYAKLLQKQNKTQQEVANATQISLTTINRIVLGLTAPGLGGNISIRTLRRLCVFHKCSPNNILDWERWIPQTRPTEKIKTDNAS